MVFSKQMVSKEGFIQKEQRLVFERLEQTPEGTIYLIPVRLEECEIPRKWKNLHYVDLWKPDDWRKLIAALNERARSLHDRKTVIPKRPFVHDAFEEAPTTPAVRVDAVEVPQAYQQSTQDVHKIMVRVASGVAGLATARVMIGLLARYIDILGFLSFLLIIAGLAGGVMLFHYVDGQRLQKLDLPPGSRYAAAVILGFFGGILGMLAAPALVIASAGMVVTYVGRTMQGK